MAKFRPYPREAYRDLFRAWARRNVKLLVLSAAVVAALLAFETTVLVWLMPDTGFTWWLLGVVQAAIIAISLQLIHSTFLIREREAIWQLRGAWGEEATRDELRRAKRKGVVWGWIDSIELQAGDLDHLVLPRKGGFVVIDSKWRSDGTTVGAMTDSARRARLRAEALAQTLLRPERASHRAKVNAVGVRPLVVIWGPAQHQVPDAFQVDGVDFVGGRALIDWLEALQGHDVERAAARDALTRLKQFRSRAVDAKAIGSRNRSSTE
jgi:hypothetical protein